MVDTAGKHRDFFDWSGTAKCRASKFLLLTNDGEQRMQQMMRPTVSVSGHHRSQEKRKQGDEWVRATSLPRILTVAEGTNPITVGQCGFRTLPNPRTGGPWTCPASGETNT